MAVMAGEGLGAQAEACSLVYLADEQPIERAVKLHEAVEIDLMHAHFSTFGIDTEVEGATVDGANFGDDELGAVFATDAITGAIQHSDQRRVVERIGTAIIGRRKIDYDAAIGDLEHHAETELGFGVTDPALSGVAIVHGRDQIGRG